MQSAYFRLRDRSATSPVILHAPHGGRLIPSEHLDAFVVSPDELEAEKDLMTDHFTDILVAGIAGASSVINGLSRFVVDVERFPDDSEEMNAVGMGVLYTHGSHRQEIRDPRRIDSSTLMQHFAEYSAAFTDLVDATLLHHGRAIIIDVHSYPEHPLAYELHADQPRPELCLGFEDFHAPAEFVRDVTEAFSQLEAVPNGPFAGAYVPLKHYQKDARVQSVMLEIRRDLYVDEETLVQKQRAYLELQDSLQDLVYTLSANGEEGSANSEAARCPRCGAATPFEIDYGLAAGPPDPSSNVVLGGCFVSDESPDFRCRECGHEWARLNADEWEEPPHTAGLVKPVIARLRAVRGGQ